MKNLLLTIAIAALMVACKKEDEVKPTHEPTVQEEYDCDSHPVWYIQIYDNCELNGVKKLVITNQESKRIDSLYTSGGCVKIHLTDAYNVEHSGYWFFSMYGKKILGKGENCIRYGKD